jgi:hypothetical protein
MKPQAREAAPLSRWALSQRGKDSELVRMYGAEHAEELGPLGWVFRAVENIPRDAPSLGQWQRFERGLRERLALLPPPPTQLAAFVPLAFIPKIHTPELNQVVGDLVWKATAVAAVTTVVTFHLVSTGALQDLRARLPQRDDASFSVAAIQPTASSLRAHFDLTRSILETPGATTTGSPTEARPPVTNVHG